MRLRDEFHSLSDLRQYFEALRGHGDIFPFNASTYIVTDYEIMRNIFRQPEDFRTFDFGDRIKQLSKIDPVKYDFEDIKTSMSDWLLFMDGPDHLHWKKKLMQRMFGLDLESIIEHEWNKVSSLLTGLETFDLVSDLCEPLICRILCSIIGFNADEFNAIRKIEKSFMKALVPSMSLPVLQEIKETHHVFNALQEEGWLKGTITQARMIDSLVRDMDSSERNRVFSQMEFMLAAGIESSIMLLTESMLRLLSDLREKQSHLLSKDTSTWVIDELIRLSSPISMVSRKVNHNVSLNEFDIKPGQILLLFIASANRDPRYFRHPERIHFDNIQTPHLAFGLGRHHCMGSELSKMEMRIILPRYIKMFGKYSVSEPEIMKRSFYTPGIESIRVRQN